jgi:hypothetical protein
LAGRWIGSSDSTWAGWVYSLEAHLTVDHGRVKGHIVWTLREFPASIESEKWWKKQIGKGGSEYVSGFLAGTKLTLDGERVDTDLIQLGCYEVTIADGSSTFEGTQQEKKPNEGRGTMHGSATVIR